jgi:hypothetical protein
MSTGPVVDVVSLSDEALAQLDAAVRAELMRRAERGFLDVLRRAFVETTTVRAAIAVRGAPVTVSVYTEVWDNGQFFTSDDVSFAWADESTDSFDVPMLDDELSALSSSYRPCGHQRLIVNVGEGSFKLAY